MILQENYSKYLQDPIFHLLSETADELGKECYVIGGYVRDLLLERPCKDIDVVVVGSGIEVARSFAKKIGRGAHLSVFKNFGTAQVKWGKDNEVEFVGARKESYHRESRNPIVEDGTLEDDQNRRDFTINALALCLNKERFGELLDPFDGITDLGNKLIRTPLDADITFSDDPLRMMRGIRFATQLNFHLDIYTFEAIARNAERIKIISQERITEELNKIMASKQPSVGFKYLEKSGGRITCSRGLNTFIETNIDPEDIIVRLYDFDDRKYILFDDFKVYIGEKCLGSFSRDMLSSLKMTG